MKTILMLMICMANMIITLFAQSEKINQLDPNGKKDGKWIEYLDAKWKVVNDSSRASYYAYNYYRHGENLFIISFGDEYKLYDKLETTGGSAQQDNKIKILDGEYKWLDKQGRTVSVGSFKNGEHVWSKYYFWKRDKEKMAGTLHEYYDFTKKYKDQKNSYYMEVYDENGKMIKGYQRDGDTGRALYQE